ncbi:MAG TPA: SDR family oxidoreductase [Polyangiaceae bacterium]|nr:SDR family oxidoreductase [Polyangiaceae bacterium]
MTWSIDGKQVLLTGASRGIGHATALALAKAGANLSLLVRNREAGEKVIEEIRALNPKVRADLIVADLSSQQEIRRAAAEYQQKHDRLDVLLNNAGAIYSHRETTVDGYERTFATNHLAYFLLTVLLLDVLKKSAPSRVVNVASLAHAWDRLDFDDLMFDKRPYHAFRAYGRSKLANVLFTRELARRLDGSGVTANCLHPGAIASGFGKNNQSFFGWVMRNLAGPFLAGEESGARTSIYLATSPEVEGKTGLYFANSRAVTPNRAARDDAAAARLWEVSERLVQKTA